MPDENDVASRFWSKVQKSDGCWFWKGYLDVHGYGHFSVSHRMTVGAHRFSYQLANGVIPDGLVIDHLCRKPPCVRPDHLEAVTQKVNCHRGMSPPAMNVVKTHCKRGHPLEGENLRFQPSGRECRACETKRANTARERKRQHRISAGLCCECDSRPMPGRRRCEYHQKRSNDYTDKWRAKKALESYASISGNAKPGGPDMAHGGESISSGKAP